MDVLVKTKCCDFWFWIHRVRTKGEGLFRKWTWKMHWFFISDLSRLIWVVWLPSSKQLCPVYQISTDCLDNFHPKTRRKPPSDHWSTAVDSMSKRSCPYKNHLQFGFSHVLPPTSVSSPQWPPFILWTSLIVCITILMHLVHTFSFFFFVWLSEPLHSY